jgi:chromosome segregation ATPase
MTKEIIIIALLLLVIYLYYQKQNNLATFTGSASPQEIEEVKKVNQIFADFCKNEIGGSDINEIRTKLNGRTLSEILEENEDYETKTDELKRKKGELESEVIMLTNSRKNQVSEKERIITRLKEEKTELDKKVKQKAKLLDEEQCENNKFAKQIENLETQVKELQKEQVEVNQERDNFKNDLNSILNK